jgi:O-antigen ligase
VVWAIRDGGYAPEEWLPGGLLALGLLCASLASTDVRVRLRARRTPLALLGLYVVWSYASTAWAQVPGDAVDGANRTLVYWLVFALFSGLALGRRASILLMCWAGAVAVVGLVELAEAATATRAQGHFVLGRLAAPISYPDADAALYLSACLVMLVLASRPGALVVSRIATGSAAVVLAALAVLCQSRGSLAVLPLALLLYLIAARSKLRALVHILLLAACVAPAVPTLLRVEPAVVAGNGWPHATGHAAGWVAICGVLGAAAFGLLAALEPRLRIGPRTRTLIGRAVLAAAAAGVLVAAGVGVAFAHPVARAETAWHDFTTNKESSLQGPHLTAGLGTSRYDVWRIALGQFRDHPLTGVGADNYLVGYLQQRRTHEVARYPESIELRALSETGIVGALLFFGFLAVALLQLWRQARRHRAPTAALACLAGCGYLLLHSSVDWFWEFPALTGVALALLAVGGAEPLPQRAGRGASRATFAAAGVAAVVVAGALAVPWAAVSVTDMAFANGLSRHSYALLNTAARLNPYSEQPRLTEAGLAAAAGPAGRARERRALHEALRRNPFDWFAYFELGILSGSENRPRVARAELAHAHRLSPQDLVVVYAQRRLAIGKPLTQRQTDAILREVTSTLRGARQR